MRSPLWIRCTVLLFMFIGLPEASIRFQGHREIEKPPVSYAWQVQESGTEVSLRGISVVNKQVAWASGGGGTFLRTTNGGKRWTVGRVPGAENLDFRDIEAFDTERAFLLSAGRPATIYRTDNGGNNWTRVYFNDAEGIFFNAVAFFDRQNAIAVGDPMQGRFMVITTANGGKSWEEAGDESLPPALPGEAGFAASGTCLTVMGNSRAWFCTGGSAARVFYSRDKGKTWQVTTTPMGDNRPTSGCFSIAFRDFGFGMMVGGDYQNETGTTKNGALTRDGGLSWSRLGASRPAGFRECVAFVPATSPGVIVTVGPSGSDYSLDDGETWTPIPGPGFHSMNFSDQDGSGWAVGKEGLVARFVSR